MTQDSRPPISARNNRESSTQARYAELARENQRGHERVMQSLREAHRIASNSLRRRSSSGSA